MDHLKVLTIIQKDGGQQTPTEESLKQNYNQIKSKMEDIILKLDQMKRKFKVTVKKKFIEEALYS